MSDLPNVKDTINTYIFTIGTTLQNTCKNYRIILTIVYLVLMNIFK